MNTDSQAAGSAAPTDEAAPDVAGRIEDVVDRADLRAVADALARRRDEILTAWLEVAQEQPFHEQHRDQAVADHIPALFDAVVALLVAAKAVRGTVRAPMEDERVLRAARSHAQMRFEQQLGAVSIATEFRLLRQEISRALQLQLDDEVPAGDIIAALAVVDDALDGATTLALATLTERLETVREEFLASTLHDVRQPITLVEASLALAVRWVRREPLDLDRLVETLDGALYATQEMSQLLDTLADASRLAMGEIELDREPVRVGEIVREALDLLEPLSRGRIEVGDLAPDVLGDWDRRAVRRIITNLLTNALKYSPEGRGIRIYAVQAANKIAITVEDQGIGLLPEELASLFQRYGRTEDARARGLPGLGLGLYASQGLAVAHGGRIEIMSDGRDKGAKARLELPAADIADDLSEAVRGYQGR